MPNQNSFWLKPNFKSDSNITALKVESFIGEIESCVESILIQFRDGAIIPVRYMGTTVSGQLQFITCLGKPRDLTIAKETIKTAYKIVAVSTKVPS